MLEEQGVEMGQQGGPCVGSVWVRFHGSEGAEAPPGCERMLSDALTI